MNILWPIYLLLILVLLWEIGPVQRRVKLIAKIIFYAWLKNMWLTLEEIVYAVLRMWSLQILVVMLLIDGLFGHFDMANSRAEKWLQRWDPE